MMNNIETILNSDFIISFGAFIEEKELKNSIVEAVKKNSAKFIYMHPVDNFDLKSWKNNVEKATEQLNLAKKPI